MTTEWTRSYIYDLETYPNLFSACVVHMDTGTRWIFEVSQRGDQLQAFVDLVFQIRDCGGEMIGFNNEHFDYPIVHWIISETLRDAPPSAYDIFLKAQAIIDAPRNDWSHAVWDSDKYVPQVDLFKIMHFDNFARSTSLKKLEIALKSGRVVDLPYPPGEPIPPGKEPVVIDYMAHDVGETARFAFEIADRIEFRRQLTEQNDRSFMNYNDTKIGKQTFINELEVAGVECFTRASGKREPRQTPRDDGIPVGERLLSVPFASPDLNRIYEFFKGSVIPPFETKGFFTDLHATIGDTTLHFGAGGLHASVSWELFDETETHEIIDVDVTSYYPSLAIVNRFNPAHLGVEFCDIYANLKKRRVSYPKGSPENASLKLALNGVYGDSNNQYSPFYDPAYTMAITINGQLLLAKLTEMFQEIGAKIIQVNTDGVTIYTPRSLRDAVNEVCDAWQSMTQLELEYAFYKRMAVRDVNNYWAIDLDGKVKRKGAYETDPDYHKDHSSLVVQKAVDAHLKDGTDLQDFIFGHTDMFDFMRHIKVPRNHRLELGGEVQQKTSRYYVALAGKPLEKVMPPLAGKTVERRNAVDKGWTVAMCNDIADFNWHNLNRRFYVQEAKKLLKGFQIK